MDFQHTLKKREREREKKRIAINQRKCEDKEKERIKKKEKVPCYNSALSTHSKSMQQAQIITAGFISQKTPKHS